MIEIRDLRKRFGSVTVLDGITTSIPAGEFVLLLGANGAGKTTFLRCLLGLHRYEGTITIGGLDVIREGGPARAQIGYVPQRPALPPDLTCAEVLHLFARLRGLPHADLTWLERVGLQESADAPARTLSGGMRQKLALAVALQADPPIILFDEPAANLDVAARRSLHRDLEDLASGRRTIILATHLAAEPLRIASRALVLDRGRTVYDGPAAGLGGAVAQRVIFTMNGTGRDHLRGVLAAIPGVRVSEARTAVIATTDAGGAFDLVAAAASAGVRPLEVHIEEPTIDTRRLAAGHTENQTK